MKRWEHIRMPLPGDGNEFDRGLELMGQNGWEVVSVVPSITNSAGVVMYYYAIGKRPAK